jgi:hypothetical protein
LKSVNPFVLLLLNSLLRFKPGDCLFSCHFFHFFYPSVSTGGES